MPTLTRDLRDAIDIAQVGFGRRDPNHSLEDSDSYSLMFEAAPNGLLLADETGCTRALNAAVEKLFGYSRTELIGQPVEAILPPHLHAGLGLHKNGSGIPVQVSFHTLETSAGPRTCYTILDISESLGHQTQLEAARRAAEEADRAKSDYLARMSHEIRTPMNLISGINELLLESSLTEAQRCQVEIADRNVRRLLRLINAILESSKSEFTSGQSGSPPPPPEPSVHIPWRSDAGHLVKARPSTAPFHPPPP
jgi:signal transduction histidine kinase